MKKLMITIGIISFFLIIPKSSLAMLPPCSESELIESSSYIIEGTVREKNCGETYKNLIPDCEEQLKDCSFLIEVTKSIKGNRKEGETVEYNTTVILNSNECLSEGPIRYGINLDIGDKIKYYAGAEKKCPGRYIEIISKATQEPTSNYWVWGGIAAIIIVLLSSVIVIKRKKAKQNSTQSHS